MSLNFKDRVAVTVQHVDSQKNALKAVCAGAVFAVNQADGTPSIISSENPAFIMRMCMSSPIMMPEMA